MRALRSPSSTDAVDERLDVLVAQDLRAGRQRLRRLERDRARVLRRRDPRREPLGDPQRAEAIRDHLARQEVVLHERAKRAGHAILARRDDRRVRNGDAERMAEQRGDREPVREPADHGGFRHCANEAEPRVRFLECAGHHVHDDGQNQQPRRPALHLVQSALAVGLVRRRRRLRGRGGAIDVAHAAATLQSRSAAGPGPSWARRREHPRTSPPRVRRSPTA